jgi:tryptophan synthase alpha chain
LRWFAGVRIQDAFSPERKALVAYLTAGDPDAATGVDAARAALDSGADILEVGVPFSDPVADGPTIQAAMQRALDGGATLHAALDSVAALRRHSDAPIILFGYLNPLLAQHDAMARIANAGATGVLVVDLPVEEAGDLRAEATQAGLDWVALVTPATPLARAGTIVAHASGFLYLVSMTGVTGAQWAADPRLEALKSHLRAITPLPICTGFGIHDRASAEAAAAGVDGVVVGSALVRALASGGPKAVGKLVADIRRGLGG